MKTKLIILNLILLLILSGCWDVNEIEKTQFAKYITVDQTNTKEDSYLFSIEFPILREESPEKVNILSTTAPSLKSAISNFQTRTMGWISLGMLRTIIFSPEIAKKGLLPHLDVLWREPIVPGSVTMAISVDPMAERISEIKPAPLEDLGVYIDELFDTTSKNSLYPQKSLNDFFIALKSSGIEATIPLIKYGTHDIQIVGLALFRKDKMIAKLKIPETRALLIIKENFIKGPIDLTVKDFNVNYYVQQVNSKIEVDYQQDKFIFNLKTELDVDITENTSGQKLIDNKKALKQMEKYLATAITKKMNNLMTQLQKNQVDTIGIGQIVKAKYPQQYDKDYWNQQFSQAEVIIEVTVNVRRFGISI